jgi:hypothetical protein
VALGLLRPLAKEVDALEVMAAILSVLQMDLMSMLWLAWFYVQVFRKKRTLATCHAGTQNLERIVSLFDRANQLCCAPVIHFPCSWLARCAGT